MKHLLLAFIGLILIAVILPSLGPVIPRTGPEQAGLMTLLGGGALGWVLKKFKFGS